VGEQRQWEDRSSGRTEAVGERRWGFGDTLLHSELGVRLGNFVEGQTTVSRESKQYSTSGSVVVGSRTVRGWLVH
jgi:hypothetical protein